MDKTSLVQVNKSDSLRTTVPASIVKLLDLRQGDRVEWDVLPDGNRFAVKIEFVKPKDARTKGRANQRTREPKPVRAPRSSRPRQF